jgi:CubicO group peptidase (beta-lactamase class C family)
VCANPVWAVTDYHDYLHTFMTSPARTPVADLDAQHERFEPAFRILEQGIQARSFPGAAVSVTHRGKLIALAAFGRFTYESSSTEVSTDSIFDVASLTKVVATTSMAMILHDRGLLDLEAPISRVLPEFRSNDARRAQVTFRMLLAHSSGLPAYEKLFLRAFTREALLRETFAVPLKHDPGMHAEYSDIGFILLGMALERIAGEPIDTFCQREMFAPLGMANTAFNPSVSSRDRIVPTAEDRTFRKRAIQGEVQDENASVMGGVAGHAGLFSAATDLAVFANAILNGGQSIFQQPTIDLFTRRELSPAGTARALGWDTPSTPSQSGEYFSAASYGHLGYTGTSLWIDPERQLSITFLTNRTWPDCSNQAIKEVRPRFHDAVVEALGSK